jgi:hypothetical protein
MVSMAIQDISLVVTRLVVLLGQNDAHRVDRKQDLIWLFRRENLEV